jgi:hypothetical protein
MELKNGYKVIYDKAANGEHVFYASKTGVFADAEEIVRATAGEYKLIYEKAGKFYGSKTGIPAEDDYCFVEFNKVFIETEAGNEPDVVNEEPATPNNKVEETPTEVEKPTAGEEEPVEEPEE